MGRPERDWAWPIKLPPMDKLVLLAMAEMAKAGEVYASKGKLSEMTGISTRRVGDVLQRLVAAGHVTKIRDHRIENGKRMATDYRLPVAIIGDAASLMTERHQGRSVITSGDTASSSLVTQRHPNLKNQKEPERAIGADAPAPATPSPSLPSSSPVRPPRKKAPKQDVEISDLSLPHGNEFRNWWVRFMDYRKQPIKGRRSPLTKLAAELILEDLAQISESDAMKALRDAITSSWIKPYTDRFERKTPASKVVPFKARASDDSYEREILRRVGGLKA